MRHIVITALVLLVSACAATPKPELPHSPDSSTAMLIYTPNYGEVRLRRVGLAEGQTLKGREMLPSISDNDIHLIRFSSNPLLQNEDLKKAQQDLGWNVAADSEIIFAQHPLAPGDYALVSYKERNSTLAYSLYGTMCFQEEAPVLRFAAGSVYYIDSINTLTKRGGIGRAKTQASADLMQVLLQQKPMVQGDVEPLDVVAFISFDQPGGILPEFCAIGRTFSEVID